MSETTCREIEGRLDAYLADELEGRELREVIAHLAGCPACRRLAEASDPLKIFVPLAARENEGGGEARWEGFWEELSGRLEERPRRNGRLLRWPVGARWNVAAAAAAAAVLIGLFLVPPGDTPVVPPAETAATTEAGVSEDDGLVEGMYINRIAQALPARIIERSGEVRELRLTRVDERENGSVNHYRAGGETAPVTVAGVEEAEQMASIIEYSLVIGEGEDRGETEEVRVVSFESEQFPFGCEGVRERD